MKECAPAVFLHNGLLARDGERLAEALRPEDCAVLGLDETILFPAPLYAAGLATSTFDIAWELAALGELPPWSAVVAASQTSGRGQMRRGWHSPPGNLYVSFFLPPDMNRLENLAPLAAGVLVCGALRDMDIPVSLKWPNDILLTPKDRTRGKFGGLLLEDKGGQLVAGLGLNLRSAPDSADLRAGYAVRATALPGFTAAPGPFWGNMVGRMRENYQRTMANASLHTIRKAVEHALAWKGRRVYAEEYDASGRVGGITDDGSLMLETNSGRVLVAFGSIALLD